MTGKELKAFAERVPDEATILVRERSYGVFEAKFEMQATLTVDAITTTREDANV